MDSFRELQQIYEGYQGQAINFPEVTSGVKAPTESKYSYRKGLLPGQTPGKQNRVMATIPLHSSDEEVTLHTMIDRLISKSRDEGINPKFLVELKSLVN